MSTHVTDRANRTERGNGDKPGKQKFGLVLQGGGALGAYEVGAVEYLYERGMECAIVTGASAGAVNAAALAGATQYPSGSPGESHPEAPTEPCLTVSRYTALLI